MNTANPATRPAPRPWRTTGYAIILLGTGFALGAASLASAGAMAWHAGWHHHHGPRVGMIQHVVHNALENVGATVTQEDKIHDIIATTYTDLDLAGAAADLPAHKRSRRLRAALSISAVALLPNERNNDPPDDGGNTQATPDESSCEEPVFGFCDRRSILSNSSILIFPNS